MRGTHAGAIIGLRRHRKNAPRPLRARVQTCWDATIPTPIEIVVPDRASAGMLVGEAGPRFSAELVERPGSGLVVRLQPTWENPRWVFELLALVERWLETCRLPVASVRHGRHTYVIAAGERHGDPPPLAA